MSTVHLIIKGKVQGVFYRATAKDVADELGIKGWVKNTPQGNVEIVASGNEEQINDFVRWCRKGPEKAVVTDVRITNREEENFKSFNIDRY
jgi:acylphosphatase